MKLVASGIAASVVNDRPMGQAKLTKLTPVGVAETRASATPLHFIATTGVQYS